MDYVIMAYVLSDGSEYECAATVRDIQPDYH